MTDEIIAPKAAKLIVQTVDARLRTIIGIFVLGNIVAIAGLFGGLYLSTKGMIGDYINERVEVSDLNEHLADSLVATGTAQSEAQRLISTVNELKIELNGAVEGYEEFAEQVASLDSLNIGSDELNQRLGAFNEFLSTQEFASTLSELAAVRSEIQFISDEIDEYFGRSWFDAKSIRQLGESYLNDTGFPIELAVTIDSGGSGQNGNSCDARIFVGETLIAFSKDNNRNADKLCFASATVPPETEYRVDGLSYPTNNGSISVWMELRPELPN